MKKLASLIVWMIFFPGFLLTQINFNFPSENVVFENIPLEKGFPDPYTMSIFQDSRGFLWFSNKKGLIRYDGVRFRIFQHKADDPGSISNNFVWHISEDGEGYLWIPTYGGGLNRFDPMTETFQKFSLKPKEEDPSPAILWSATVDTQNRIWIGTRGDGLYIIEADRNTPVRHFLHDPSDPESLSSNYIGRVLEDMQGQFWVPTERGGLNLFDPDSGKSVRFRHQPDNSNSLISDLIYSVRTDKKHRLWIPSYNGLSIMEPGDTSFTNLRHQKGVVNGLSTNFIYSLNVDSQDRIWLATSNGLNLYDPEFERFLHYFHDPLNPHSLIHDYIFATYEDRSGVLWITTANGVSKLSNTTFSFISLVNTLEEKKNSDFEGGFKDMLEDVHGNIWIATNNGLYVYELHSGTYRHFLLEPNWRVNEIGEDRNGKIWISSNIGLFYYDRQLGTLFSICDSNPELCEQAKNWKIDVFTIGPKGNLWMNDNNDLLQVELPSLRLQRHEPQNKAFVAIRNIQFDHFGNVWVGGDGGGLLYFNIEQELFSYPEIPDFPIDPSYSFAPAGLPIFSIDPKGFLWINQNGRLWQYPIDQQGNLSKPLQWKTKGGRFHIGEDGAYWLVTSESITAFNPKEGLKNSLSLKGITKRLDGSLLSSASGRIYLGGYQGMYYFDPDQVSINKSPPPVVLTDLKIANQRVPIKGSFGDTLAWTSPLEKSITFTEHITLPHDLNDIIIEFAALDFHQPERNQYKFILEGDDSDTLFINGGEPLATYTNLSPGNYTFHVWGSNNDRTWSPESTSLGITISPPWYWSTWSKLLYLLIILGIIYTLYHFQLRRSLAAAEAQRLQELDTVKTRLYTNITHEFRTPLTVISGMADLVLEDPASWFREGLRMIKRNSQHLLGLVNQMLDLSKLESGRLPVNMVQNDIVKYLKYVTESFHSFAESKDIRLHLLSQVEELYMDFDPEKIQAIVGNLLSNAIKFTPAGGDVYITVDGGRLTVDGGSLEVRVKDNGVGIPAEQLPYIFDRFYQADNSSTREGEGTGIGLALTRELVKLLGGRITVTSQVGKGTEFTVVLPVTRAAEKEKASAHHQNNWDAGATGALSIIPEAATAAAGTTLPLALLIEDNQDVLQYLAACLQGQYRLEMAGNGQIGIEQAIELVPDIIISDVMMPEKDGFEVVNTLKQDERTSHIPIILLTAKADMESRLEGLEQGADAYLAKPFHKKELEVRLRKLIEIREQLQKRYRALDPVNNHAGSPADKEHGFLQKIRERIEARLSDEDYGISELCTDLAVSRTQLHRKLKALTGKSTSHIIRSIRLQKAKELLENSDLNVSEVGYAVGFSNRSHFTSVFKEEFGEAPSYFRDGG